MLSVLALISIITPGVMTVVEDLLDSLEAGQRGFTCASMDDTM